MIQRVNFQSDAHLKWNLKTRATIMMTIMTTIIWPSSDQPRLRHRRGIDEKADTRHDRQHKQQHYREKKIRGKVSGVDKKKSNNRVVADQPLVWWCWRRQRPAQRGCCRRRRRVWEMMGAGRDGGRPRVSERERKDGAGTKRGRKETETMSKKRKTSWPIFD